MNTIEWSVFLKIECESLGVDVPAEGLDEIRQLLQNAAQSVRYPFEATGLPVWGVVRAHAAAADERGREIYVGGYERAKNSAPR